MEIFEVIMNQVLSAPILFFLLGIIAVLIGSDLKISEEMGNAMVIFLLIAIGLKGGIGISKVGIVPVLLPGLAAISLGAGIVLLGFAILSMLKFGAANAGAIAAHYGAVSSVTMFMGLAMLDRYNEPYEAFIPALYPFMDSTAIISAILLARTSMAKQKEGNMGVKTLKIFKDTVLGKAVLLLAAGLVIGYVVGYEGTKTIMPFFDGMFKGVLSLFMIGMGILAGSRLKEFKSVGLYLMGFAIVMPLIHIILGVFVGTWIGLSVGGATMLGILAGSSSYVSAPAAMKAAIPEANPAFYLTASIGVTFPLNVIFYHPLSYTFAKMLG